MQESVISFPPKWAFADTRFSPGDNAMACQRKIWSPLGSRLAPRDFPLSSKSTSVAFEYTLMSVTGAVRSVNRQLVIWPGALPVAGSLVWKASVPPRLAGVSPGINPK